MVSHRYMLDTNIISSLIKNPQGQIYQKLKDVFPLTVCTSIVVSAEIQYGIQKGVSRKLHNQIKEVIEAIDVLPLEQPVALKYGELRAYLHKTGKPIGYNDLFIAAHAIALDLILVTDNIKEFERVPELKLENWLEGN